LEYDGSDCGVFLATPTPTPQLVVRNKNTFTFHYGNGDYYTGTVYADPTTYRYYLGYTEAKTDEHGRAGYYEITGVESGKFKAKPGEVYLNGYYDVESNQTFTPMNKGKITVGKTYLGSKVDYIIKKNVEQYRFGLYKGVFYEADK
jgi:putative transposon-encoded protein